jgi:hypothetical protein
MEERTFSAFLTVDIRGHDGNFWEMVIEDIRMVILFWSLQAVHQRVKIFTGISFVKGR